jgi:hypothetical protein
VSLDDVVGGHFNPNHFAILADFQAWNGDSRERLLDAAIGGDCRAAAELSRGLHGGDLLLSFLLGKLRIAIFVGHFAQLLLQQRHLLLRGLPRLLGLGQLPVQVGVVQVELGHAAVQILHLRGQRLGLLLHRAAGRRRSGTSRRLKGPVLASSREQSQRAHSYDRRPPGRSQAST